MTARMYYDNDANPEALEGQTVAVIACLPPRWIRCLAP